MSSNVVEGKKGRNWQNLQVIEPVQTNRLRRVIHESDDES